MSPPGPAASDNADQDPELLRLRKQVLRLEKSAQWLGDELLAKWAECDQLAKTVKRLEQTAHQSFYQALRHAGRHPKAFFQETAALLRQPFAAPDPATTVAKPKTEGIWPRYRRRRSEMAQLERDLSRWLGTADGSSDRESSSPPVSLLLAGHEASLTGAPKALLELARELKAGYQVNLRFIFLAAGGMLRDYEALGPCLVLDGKRSEMRGKIKRVIRRFSNLAGQKKAIVNTIQSGEFLPPLARQGIESVCWVHDSVACIEEHARGLATMKEIRRSARKIIYSSPANLHAARTAFSLDEAGTSAIRYGVRPSATSAKSEIPPALAALGIRAGSPLILGCGTIQIRKGVDLFLQAALYTLRQCPADRPLPQFVWVGREVDAALGEKIRIMQHADSLGVHVHFLDETTDVAAYFRACDLFVLTSRDDPYPLVTLEAMSLEKPVLAFAGATGQEELFASCPEMLVPSGNALAMGDRIFDFIERPEDFAAAARASSKLVKELLSWPACARSFAAELDLAPV